MEKFQFALYCAFEAICCNPEWWFITYMPIASGMLFN